MIPQPTVVRALADTFFPPADDAPSGSEVVPSLMDDLLASMDANDVRQLSVALRVFEAGALPLYRRRFSRLPAAQRAEYLEGWMKSRLGFRREVYRALRNLITNLYYADERTWAALGYEGPRVERRRAS